MILSIITATYNRDYSLPQIYSSLLANSTVIEFEWIIVDDGSTDKTEELVKGWLADEKIRIVYVKQANGGKTRAIINGFSQKPKGDFTIVLDSDDYLTNEFFSNLREELPKLDKKLLGIIGLKGTLDGNLIGGKFVSTFSTYLDLYFGSNKTHGDKLFVIRTDEYKESFKLPYEGEKFIPDNIPYLYMNDKGKYLCVNKIFYKGDYLADGMTSNVLRFASKNIRGYIYEKQLLQQTSISLKEKIKNEAKYISYSLGADYSWSRVVKDSNDKIVTGILLFPVSILFRKRIKAIKKFRKQ
ncbi:glycosyltransferase family 2 protein [Myroides odoratimimus]|uniref:glycosyltransferase family 2 protein n=1 Tax=Myroides odoratimimus TaxID=76832 RepID=UPI003D2F6C73